MVTRNLIESASLVSAPSESETWKVRLINEGRGSSGIYSRELLENYRHAFDDVISFLNHPTDGPETRNFTEIAGRVVGETWTEIESDGTLGVYANWEPDEDHRRKLEKYKDKLGLSIYIAGSGEVDDNGDFRVTEFDTQDPFRSVDVVIAAGRGGRFGESAIKKMYESRRSESVETTATAAEEMERNKMESEKIVEALQALTAQISTLVAAQESKAAQSAQAEADAKAVEAAVAAYDAAVKAVEAADLLAPQKEALLEDARSGKDISSQIESAKAVKQAAVEAARITESAPGRDFGNITEVTFSGFGGGK